MILFYGIKVNLTQELCEDEEIEYNGILALHYLRVDL